MTEGEGLPLPSSCYYMENTVKIPKTLLHKLKKDEVTLSLLRELHREIKDPTMFYNKCSDILKTDVKLEEKLKNK